MSSAVLINQSGATCTSINGPYFKIMKRLKNDPETNDLAYLSRASLTIKSFTVLTPGVKVIKLFSLSQMHWVNKLEYIQLNLIFLVKSGSLPILEGTLN
jgi:hypothetical protein